MRGSARAPRFRRAPSETPAERTSVQRSSTHSARIDVTRAGAELHRAGAARSRWSRQLRNAEGDSAWTSEDGAPGYLLDCPSIPRCVAAFSLLRSSPPRRWGWPAAERRAGRRRPPRSSPHRRRPRSSSGSSPTRPRRRPSSSASRLLLSPRTGGRRASRSRTGPTSGGRSSTGATRTSSGFGVMLFPTGDHKERRTAQQQPLYLTDTRVRHVPTGRAPGRAGARDSHGAGRCPRSGALAGGLWVRIAFGPFSSVGEPPKGVQSTGDYMVHGSHLPVAGGRRSPGLDSPCALPLATGSLNL